MGWFRKLGAVVKMGITWAIAYIPLSGISITLLSVASGSWPHWFVVKEAMIAGAFAGGLSGAIFAGLIAATERRKTVASLSARRLIGAGVLAALVPPGLLALKLAFSAYVPWEFAPLVARVLLVSGALGAVCAGGLLYVARRAPALPGEASRAALSDGS